MESKLYEASVAGDVQALNALIHQDHLILHRLSLTGNNETPLHIAAMRGHHQFSIALLNHDPNLTTAMDSQRRIPLHLAAASGNVEIVKELVRVGGPDVCCAGDEDGLTPLHFAAMNEQLEIVKLLVRENVDAAKKISATGETILHMCVNRNCIESLKALMELWNEEELASMTDHGGNTLLHAAAINKHTQILNHLLRIPSIKDNGNAVNRNGLTALDMIDHCPRDLKSFETRKILMEAGVLKANDIKPLPKTPLTKSSPTNRKGFLSRTWAAYVSDDNRWVENQRGILIIAALVVAGISFLSGIHPPGGTITDTSGRYSLGNAILAEVDMDEFNHLVAYNSITMISSLCVILVLISGVPVRNKFWMWVVTICSLLAMVAMVVTYLQSLSAMGADGYVNVTSVFICLIWMLLCGLTALIHTIFFVIWVVRKLLKSDMVETNRKDASEV